MNRVGYYRVWLYDGKGNKKMHFIHRLVAGAFKGDIEGMTVEHDDFDRSNNHLMNLRILPWKQNNAMKRRRIKWRVPIPERLPSDPF